MYMERKIKLNKKYLIALIMVAAVIVIVVAGCSKEEEPISAEPTIIELDPSALLTVEQATAAVGYELTADGITADADGTKTVLYHPEPLGLADTVQVSVKQYSESVSKDSIRSEFDSDREARSDAEAVDATGVDVYIALPSIRMYYDGYYITITAGSGSDDGQKNLLVSLAQTAAANLSTLLPA